MRRMNVLIFIFLIFFVSCKQNPGSLEGNILYKNNETLLIYPDTQSNVYVVSKITVKQSKIHDISDMMNCYFINKSDYRLELVKLGSGEYFNKVKERFEKVSSTILDYITMFQGLPGCNKAIADLNGNFLFTLGPGEYYILIISGNSKELNLPEPRNAIEFKKIEIKAGTKTNFKFNFE